MRNIAVTLIVILLQLASVIRHASGQGFFGTLVTNIAEAAAQQAQQQQQLLAEAAAQPLMPSVAEQERIQAIQRAKMNQVSATEAQAAAKEVSDTYKQLEQDLAMPLAQKTSHLKAERLQLMRRISSLTREVRSAYDKLHPDMVDRPLIIVAKTADDDMRAVANRIDAQGSLDDLQGILSPCAEFHNEREAQKKELEVVQSMNNLDEEARALSRMSPEERLTYDRNMSEEYGYKKEQLARDVKRAERQAGIYRPTVLGTAISGVLGGLQAGTPFPTGRPPV